MATSLITADDAKALTAFNLLPDDVRACINAIDAIIVQAAGKGNCAVVPQTFTAIQVKQAMFDENRNAIERHYKAKGFWFQETGNSQLVICW